MVATFWVMLCNYECRWQNGRLFRFPREKKVIFIWVTRPGRQKGAKDEVKRPEARNRDPEGPQTSSIFIKKIPFDDFPKNQALKEPKPRLKSLLGQGARVGFTADACTGCLLFKPR